jgi:hypothetical protein
MTTTPTALTSLPAAEQHLVAAINAATSTLDTIATGAVDAALVHLDAAAGACRERIASAMSRLSCTVAGVVLALDAAVTGVFEDLSTEAHVRRAGIDPDALPPVGPPSEGAPVPFVRNCFGVSDSARKQNSAARGGRLDRSINVRSGSVAWSGG